VTEVDYTGAFFADGSKCRDVADVKQSDPGYFIVYPLSAGGCDIIVTDERKQSTLLHVSVTTTTVGGQ
jgi:hypothetical protein